MEREDQTTSAAGSWTRVERKRKITPDTYTKELIYPKRHFWCGFDVRGTEKWFIELNNGRIVSSSDENYHYWLKRFCLTK